MAKSSLSWYIYGKPLVKSCVTCSKKTLSQFCFVTNNDERFFGISEELMIMQPVWTHSGFLQTLDQWHKEKGGHGVTSGLEPWLSDPRHSCLGCSSLVCVPVRTCILWSFICRSLSITAMFPEPDHLQQLKVPLLLAGSAGLWSTLHYSRKKSCFANGCKRGSGVNPLPRTARLFPHSVQTLKPWNKTQTLQQAIDRFSVRLNITSL